MSTSSPATFWQEKDKTAVHMPKTQLLGEIEAFIHSHNTCALATGFGEFVRCTPIEYNYMEGKFWLLSEGGIKFYALENNKNVCLAIFDNYTGFGSLGGMQIMGVAELVEPWSEEYRKLLEFKKIPEQNLKGLPHTLYLIKVTPVQIDFTWSEFKKKGYDPRQSIVF